MFCCWLKHRPLAYLHGADRASLLHNPASTFPLVTYHMCGKWKTGYFDFYLHHKHTILHLVQLDHWQRRQQPAWVNEFPLSFDIDIIMSSLSIMINRLAHKTDSKDATASYIRTQQSTFHSCLRSAAKDCQLSSHHCKTNWQFCKWRYCRHLFMAHELGSLWMKNIFWNH